MSSPAEPHAAVTTHAAESHKLDEAASENLDESNSCAGTGWSTHPNVLSSPKPPAKVKANGEFWLIRSSIMCG